MLTWLEIDARAIIYNLRQFKKLIGKQTLLMPVIKSNAYGHGFFNIAQICHTSPIVDRICVVNIDEALALINAGLIKKPIFILSFFDKDIKKLKIAVDKKVIFPLYSLADAQLLNRVGENMGKKITVHIKVDTGTSRLGILPNEVVDFVTQVKKFKQLTIEGLWSHFASSEENTKDTFLQNKKLDDIYTALKKQGVNIPLRHIACSAAIANYGFSRQDAVRLGLSLYGLHPNPHKQTIALKPALSWYTTVIAVKTVPKGAKIGYGGTFVAKKPTKIAVLPVGYFDGYDRKLSNNGHVLIKGKICPIRGRICMNLCMVEVGNLSVKAGDRATLIGRDKTQAISAESMAAWCHTINYEVVTRINPVLPRITV